MKCVTVLQDTLACMTIMEILQVNLCADQKNFTEEERLSNG